MRIYMQKRKCKRDWKTNLNNPIILPLFHLSSKEMLNIKIMDEEKVKKKYKLHRKLNKNGFPDNYLRYIQTSQIAYLLMEDQLYLST